MYYIPIVVGSIRRNRESLKIAKFVFNTLSALPKAQTEVLDLKELNIPMMEERLRFRSDAPSSIIKLSISINRADAVVIVTPEYNSGYPGVLKNALDYLKDEYRRKPFGIITVSSAWSGGILCLASLRQVILHLGGVPIPAALPIPMAQGAFDEDGNPQDPKWNQRAKKYFEELLWFTEALAAQRQKDISHSESPGMGH
jgi:NAD(P)H-dependent FMN reductase